MDQLIFQLIDLVFFFGSNLKQINYNNGDTKV